MSISSTNAVKTGTLVGLREDLSDIIMIADTQVTPFYSWCADAGTIANARKHEWEDQTYQAKRSNGQQNEAADYAIGARQAPTRYENVCEILHKTPGVSATSEAVDSAGNEGKLDRETVLQGVELRRDVNFTALSANVRQTSEPRRMSAIQCWPGHTVIGTAGSPAAPTGDGSDAFTNASANVEFSQALYEDLLQAMSDAGAMPGINFMGGTQKRKFNAVFDTAGAVQNRMEVNPLGASNSAGGGGRITDGATAVLNVSMVETDWGRQVVIYDQDVDANQILVFDTRDRYQPKICTLAGRNFRTKDLPETGDWMARDLRWEGTLQVPSPNSVGIMNDLSTTFS